MKKVKCTGSTPSEPPKPVAKAVIDGQGSIPYATLTEEATPNTAVGKITRGTKRGMGAALRGGRYTSA